jgi:hypothetical protein
LLEIFVLSLQLSELGLKVSPLKVVGLAGPAVFLPEGAFESSQLLLECVDLCGRGVVFALML